MSNGFQNLWRVGTLDCYPKFSGETDYVFTVHWDCLSYYSGVSGGPFYGRTYSCTAIPATTGEFIPYENLTEPMVLGWVWGQMGEDQKNQYESGAMQQIYNQLVPPVVQPPLPWSPDVFPIIPPSVPAKNTRPLRPSLIFLPQKTFSIPLGCTIGIQFGYGPWLCKPSSTST